MDVLQRPPPAAANANANPKNISPTVKSDWRDELLRIRQSRLKSRAGTDSAVSRPRPKTRQPTPLEEKIRRWQEETHESRLPDLDDLAGSSGDDDAIGGETPPRNEVRDESAATSAPVDEFETFVQAWRNIPNTRQEVDRPLKCSELPWPHSGALERMLSSHLHPRRRLRSRHRTLLLLLHPDKSWPRLAASVEPVDTEAVKERLISLSQMLNSLGARSR